MYGIGDFLRRRQYLAEELHFAGAQSTAAAFEAQPAEVETHQLPHGIQAEATRHHRVPFEVASEEPQVRMNIQLGNDLALAEATAGLTDVRDAVNHQHVGGGQLCVTGAE